MIGVALFNLRYLTNFFGGPRPASRGELLALDNPDGVARNWVDVTGDKNYDTGMQMVSTSSRSSNETVEANYMALLIDDRLLLVKTASDADVTSYNGALVPIPADVQTEVVKYIERSEDVKGAFLPYMLDANNFRTNGFIGLSVGGLTLLACLYLIGTGIQRGDSARHPIMRRLARHGDTTAVISEVENELLAPNWTHGTLHATRNWLVQAAPAEFNAMRLSEIVWLYKHVTQRRVNFIPAGKTFAAHILDAHGQKLAIRARNQKDADAILTGVLDAAPWALAGYDAEIEKTWNRDRSAVIDAVAQRRQQGGAAEA